MRKLQLTIATLIVAAAGTTYTAMPRASTPQFPQGQRAVQIPVKILANVPYVEVKINGRGPFGFLVDTGSMNSPFARELAEQMGLDRPPSAKTGQPTDVGLAEGVSVQIPSSFSSFAGLSALPGRTIFGAVGYNVLKGFVVKIDYEHGVITLFDPANFRYTGTAVPIPFELVMGYDPQFEGELLVDDGPPIRAKFTLDTGAGGTVVSVPLVKANDMFRRIKQQVPLPSSKALVDGVDGMVFEAVTGRIKSITFGKYTLKRPLVSLSRDTDSVFAEGMLGINVGGNILRRFNVFIDYPRQQLILEPNGHFDEPFAADASGLVLTTEGANFKTIVVHGVVTGSAADEDGMKEGDVITAIDGKSTDGYALYEIQELFKESGRQRQVTIKRGDQVSIVTLKLRGLA